MDNPNQNYDNNYNNDYYHYMLLLLHGFSLDANILLISLCYYYLKCNNILCSDIFSIDLDEDKI